MIYLFNLSQFVYEKGGIQLTQLFTTFSPNIGKFTHNDDFLMLLGNKCVMTEI